MEESVKLKWLCTLPPVQEVRCLLARKLAGPQFRYGWLQNRKISGLAVNIIRFVQHVVMYHTDSPNFADSIHVSCYQMSKFLFTKCCVHCRCKGKVFILRAMQPCWGSGSELPLIINLGTEWYEWSLHSKGKSRPYTLNKRLGGPQS